MPLKFLLGALLGPCVACAALAQPLEQLAWLAGCWNADSGEPGSSEHWMALAGGTMLGVGRTVRGGRTVEFEFMQIRTDAEGKVVFVARPSGQREASFTLKTHAANEVTFENLAHDFPQRIIYRLHPDDKLAARIEGMRSGVLRGIDFPMRRVSCDAQINSSKSK